MTLTLHVTWGLRITFWGDYISQKIPIDSDSDHDLALFCELWSFAGHKWWHLASWGLIIENLSSAMVESYNDIFKSFI